MYVIHLRTVKLVAALFGITTNKTRYIYYLADKTKTKTLNKAAEIIESIFRQIELASAGHLLFLLLFYQIPDT